MEITDEFETFASKLLMARRPVVAQNEHFRETKEQLTQAEKDIIEQAPNCLEMIGFGLARIVFEDTQTETVFKIARIGNTPVTDGKKQNESEVHTFQEWGDEFSLVPITDHHKDFLWVQMEKVPLLTETVDEDRADEVEIGLTYHFTECPDVDVWEVFDENIGVYEDKGALIDYGGSTPEPNKTDVEIPSKS